MNISVCANTIDVTDGGLKEVRDFCRRLHSAGASYACILQRDPDEDTFFAAMQIPLAPPACQRVLYLALRKVATMKGCKIYVWQERLYIKGAQAQCNEISRIAHRLTGSVKRVRSYTCNPYTHAGVEGPALSVSLLGLEVIKHGG
jgi:hypothetical protein